MLKIQPALIIYSESEDEIPDFRTHTVESSFLTLPRQSSNTIKADTNETRKQNLLEIPTLSDVCSCRKSSERLFDVEYKEMNESPRTKICLYNLITPLSDTPSGYNNEKY